MPYLPSNGPISMSMFNTILGRAANTTNSKLAGGSIVTNDSLIAIASGSGSVIGSATFNTAAPHSFSEWYNYIIYYEFILDAGTVFPNVCDVLQTPYNVVYANLGPNWFDNIEFWTDFGITPFNGGNKYYAFVSNGDYSNRVQIDSLGNVLGGSGC